MAKNITAKIVDAGEDVVEVVEDVVEEAVEVVEDGIEFLSRPEVLITILLLFITIAIIMYFMKRDDEVEII